VQLHQETLETLVPVVLSRKNMRSDIVQISMPLVVFASGAELTRKLTEREEMFEKRFQSTFKLQHKVRLRFNYLCGRHLNWV